MAVTPNYQMVLPDVGGSVDVWGGDLNGNLNDIIDVQMKDNETAADDAQTDATQALADAAAAQATADAALPVLGGEMEGRVDVYTSATRLRENGSVSGSVTLDGSIANYHKMSLSDPITTFLWNNMTDISGHAQVYILDIVSNGHTIDWSGFGTIYWAYGVEPTLSTTGGRDIFSFITLDGGSTWTASLSQADCQ